MNSCQVGAWTRFWYLAGLILLFMRCGVEGESNLAEKPNIIYILADDLGIGDLSCYSEKSKIKTSHLDRLASAGLRFTDAHSGSAVCTPTRYGILTGRYAWRTRLKSGVLWSYDKHLIDPQRMTVSSLLKSQGYHTSFVGKWHLGLDWAGSDDGNIDFEEEIVNGPNAIGFDDFFGITASLDIPPYFYIENKHITARTIDTIEAMAGKKFWRRGPIGEDFEHEDVLPTLTDRAVEYVKGRSRTEDPFFLFFSLPAPHTPILPTPEFLGKSGTNEYGDFVLMVDDVVGKIMGALKETGMEDNTMIIFTSDNGCSPMADFEELALFEHYPSDIYRGHKADIYEGGHRVPFIVRWPGKIREGVTDQTVCLTDLLATAAAMCKVDLPEDAGVDSYDLTPILLEANEDQMVREATVHHSIDGNFAIRQGDWKLIFCPGSGGWSFPRARDLDTLALPDLQLYDLEADPGEIKNVVDEHPMVVEKLTTLMNSYIDRGRSTPGEIQQNEGITNLFE